LKKLILIPLLLGVLSFTGCSSDQKEEVKRVTAIGLGNGLSGFLMNEATPFCSSPILECADPVMAQEYIVEKSCSALKADCSASGAMSSMRSSGAKGVIARFACRTAVKTVGQVLFPSKHMPEGLKRAGCTSSCLDGLAENALYGFCEKV
jgi:hypothetical protein